MEFYPLFSETMCDPFVSIIVAVKNSEGTIRQCLESVLSNDYFPREIIVVDDGSSDRTPAILADFKDSISIMTNTVSMGPARSRNSAAQRARGEYIAFTDGDCIAGRIWIRELVRGFGSGAAIAACGGVQDIPVDASAFEKRVFAFLRKASPVTEYVKPDVPSPIREVWHNPSCNVMYRRKVYLDAGGFLPGLWPGEDVELDLRLRRAGQRLVFNPAAVVYHYRPRTLGAFVKMMHRYGAAQGCLVRRYGLFRRAHFVPVLSFLMVPAYVSLLFFNAGLFGLVSLLVFFAAYVYVKDIIVIWLGICALVAWNAGFVKGFIRKTT